MRSLAILLLVLCATGCSGIKGERFWWDDQKREKLPDSYVLPEWPAQAPVPTDPAPFVPKPLPEDEIKRATDAQMKMIEQGIPKSGVPDPLKDRQKIPVAKWQGGEFEETTVNITESAKGENVSSAVVEEKDGNIDVETKNESIGK